MVDVAANFGGSIPEYYDRIMGPAQFEPYGADLVRRVPRKIPGGLLEIACGSGRVTRQLRQHLAPETRLVASDISAGMLDFARARITVSGIDWREADACKLPFADAEFGAAVCAFGVMFVPDKAAAFREARRVLRAGSPFLFNVWDGLEANPHGQTADEVLGGLFPGDPSMKSGSMPYLFNDRKVIGSLLEKAGFRQARAEAVRIACSAPSAREFATGQIRGTPRGQLLAQRGVNVDEVITQIGSRLARIGGEAPFRYTAQALVVEAEAI